MTSNNRRRGQTKSVISTPESRDVHFLFRRARDFLNVPTNRMQSKGSQLEIQKSWRQVINKHKKKSENVLVQRSCPRCCCCIQFHGHNKQTSSGKANKGSVPCTHLSLQLLWGPNEEATSSFTPTCHLPTVCIGQSAQSSDAALR